MPMGGKVSHRRAPNAKVTPSVAPSQADLGFSCSQTLPEWISHREPSVTARDFLNEAAELMRQLAVGLRAMHDTGFAHPCVSVSPGIVDLPGERQQLTRRFPSFLRSDLKPENLVVEEESGVFVIKMFHFGSTIHEGRVGTSPAGYEYSGTFPYSGPDHIISRFMIPIRDFLDSKEGKRWLKSLDDSAWRTFSTDRKTLYSAYEEMRCYTQASVLPLSRSRPPTPASRPGDPRRRNLFAYFAIL
ncbi:hypothetical protein BCR35DRAFT_219150 [Leucosporidium creatinivorum]|uniref:Protein kinase domain-containing protein n=1 Tax=Leucosporidium creatinivorum TaxID=106004 RepID=A0A1Y2FZ41_9BASI|nr:hypothetical protein BCR35DRAFT_219150 [Leucosporidium creatinivorum]